MNEKEIVVRGFMNEDLVVLMAKGYFTALFTMAPLKSVIPIQNT